MIKIDKKILALIVLSVIGYYLFYWYELRPAKIKHDCSWYKVVDVAIPAINKEEAEASKAEYDKCVEENKKKKEEAEASRNSETWKEFNTNLLDDWEAPSQACYNFLKYERSYTPEKEWYRKAKDTEYDFCLHEKGV